MKRFFPLGFAYPKEIALILGALLLAILRSLAVLVKIMGAKAELTVHGQLIPGKQMPDFVDLAQKSSAGFMLVILGAMALMLAHYRFHYRETKSIYTMKRLKSPFALHFRCLLFPLFSMLLAVVLAISLIFFYYIIYMQITAKICINSGQWERLLRAMTKLSFYV